MPIYQVDIQTKAGGIFVSNVYHVAAADLPAARTAGLYIAHTQATLVPTFWSIDHMRISTPAPNDGLFISIPLAIPGTRSGAGVQLPPFCRYRVDFEQGFKRPCRKFIIGVLEGDTEGDDLTQSAIDFVQTNYVNPLFTNSAVVLTGPDGTIITAGQPAKAVGMRQLRRASKRKSPVIG